MEYLASNPDLWGRQLDTGAEPANDSAFDDWLNGYLAEVLPAQQQRESPAQMPLLPDLPPHSFPWQPPGPSPAPGHDVGSSTSGETLAHEQAMLPAAEHDTDDGRGSNRAARIADKNRRAQKRFREREKQRKATLETQVAELSARLSEVSQEKARLESRNSVLEKVVKLKDEYITNLESSASIDESEDRPYMNPSLKAALCEFYAIVRNKRSKYEDEDFIPMDAIHTTHKAYIDELARTLMEGAEQPDTPAHARMVQLTNANREILRQIAVLNDRLYMGIRAEQVLPGATAAARPDAAHWKTVVDTVALSGPQKEAVLTTRSDLLARMRCILDERQALVNSLQMVHQLVTEGQVDQYPRQMECKQLAMLQLDGLAVHAQRQKALERLQKNLKEEYRAVVDYEVAFFNTILTPLQQARMQVASYPWPTDSLAICGIVAEETGLAGQDGQAPVQEDFMALLTSLPNKSPFRALAAPMPVG